MNSFYEQFADSARRFPAGIAVEVQRPQSLERYTYPELAALADSAARFLLGRGFARGDRAAILADNDAHWCAAYLGLLRLGAVPVPLDTAYKPAQIAALLRDSGAKVLFTTGKYLAASEEAARACSPSPEIVLLHDEGVGARYIVPLRAHQDSASPNDLPPCPATPDDPAVILYTSGTTSDPKGVVLTHRNLLAERDAVFQIVHIDEHDSILGVLPLFHALAQLANLLLPFAVGARVVFLEQLNTTELLRALTEREITLFVCVPQFFYLIHQRVMQQVAAAGRLRRSLFRLLLRTNGALRRSFRINFGPAFFRPVHRVLGPRMRLLVTGGSRFDPSIGRDLYALGFNILQAYGLTETSGAACVTHPGDPHIDSVGPPLPGAEVQIAPPDASRPGANGDDRPRDGEVLIRGPIVMQGYFNRPDANARALEGGWLHTGDLGYLDDAGRLHITGRSKEIIILASGKNIYPEEIEAHYLQCPYIKEICVMGLARPGEPAAERLHAVVVPDFDVLRERKVLIAKEMLRFEIEGLSLSLPTHKRILSYALSTDELPRTTTRKLKRFQIEQRVREQQEKSGSSAESIAASRTATDADLAWAARPDVARALEVIRAASKSQAALHPDDNIELALALDSMERVELLTQLQELFGTVVSDEVAHRIYTVRELVEAVLPRSAAAAAVGAAPIGAPTKSVGVNSGHTPRQQKTDGDAWARLLASTPEDDPDFRSLLEPKPFFAVAMFVVMKLLYGAARVLYRFRVRGLEKLPADGPFILCPNHQSYLDPFFLIAALPFRVFRNIFIVGASEYFATPVMRWFARKVNLMPVDPDTNLLRAMQAGAYGLRHGKVLVLFPEGERSIDGSPRKFKKGASILSLHLRAPIVPIAIDGVYDVWPRGGTWRLTGRVSIEFGAVLSTPVALPAGATLAQAEARYAAEADSLRAVVLDLWTALHRQLSAARS